MPPTAIKAQYFFYTYTSSREDGSWWKQTAIENNDEMFWIAKTDRWKGGTIESLPHRSRILLFIVLFIFLKFFEFVASFGPSESMSNRSNPKEWVRVSASQFLMQVLNWMGGWTVFLQTLLLDYPALRGEVCKLHSSNILEFVFAKVLSTNAQPSTQYQSIFVISLLLGIINSANCLEVLDTFKAMFMKIGGLALCFILIFTSYDAYKISQNLQE